MTARRLLAAMGLGIALLLAGGAPSTAADAAEGTVLAEMTPGARTAVRRRRSPLHSLLRARPARPPRRNRPVHVNRLRPAAGHEAPRRAPPTLLI